MQRDSPDSASPHITPDEWLSGSYVKTHTETQPLVRSNFQILTVDLAPSADFNPAPYTADDWIVLGLEGGARVDGISTGIERRQGA